MITKQHFADMDDSEIKSDRQRQLKCQYLQGFKDGVESQREFCTDAVSRKAVLKSLCELGYGDEENGAEAEYMYALQCVADKVKALPSVTPERPKGEWKSDGHGHIYCTNCNQTNVSMWKSDFCPICGSYNGQTLEG